MPDNFPAYCNSLTSYSRFRTREVRVGDVPLGGGNPIRIQSMTTTDTMDTLATVEQTIRLAEAGCDYVRITAPSLREAENLSEIKKELHRRGYTIPLIADIHYTPNAAEAAARIVEKVRINPGNFADKKRFDVREYSDAEYNAELDRIRERFTPLVRICKEHGTAMRIGSNHGSLSDRIMNRYGDTPEGMVQSAFEFVSVCEDLGYHDIVLSMKASNPRVMVQAYRLLAARLMETGRNYPLHIGVTEAGDGEDGRIKSAVGIGALLEDGIGDTVRVSLTEDPEAEVPVAGALVNRYALRKDHAPILPVEKVTLDPFECNRRTTREVMGLGGDKAPAVILSVSDNNIKDPLQLRDMNYSYSTINDKWLIGDSAPDFLYLGTRDLSFHLPGSLRKIFDAEAWRKLPVKDAAFPLFTMKEYLENKESSASLNFVRAGIHELGPAAIQCLKKDKTAVLVLVTSNLHGMAEQRRAFMLLMDAGVDCPVIVKRDYMDIPPDLVRLYAATDLGALLTDGLGDGVWIEGNAMPGVINSVAFGILQATRTRISRTEYIACPSCGRTLFDLQEVTRRIRSRTGHLKGVRIGIMGCIVNGPGEMADADYGYVGSGPGKITLYRGKEVVKRSVNSDVAVDELISLIKADGKWVEPNVNVVMC